jgi:aerobic-type carbon monoxide dehydrogenase small subunit (CoxS/CutS family)
MTTTTTKRLQLIVNGKKHSVSAEPDRPLLTVLRDELGLTGAKYGCGEGACGACTVIVEGAATRSCVTAPHEVAGKRITTIEGLETNGALHPVQQAFIDAGAMQCGYCIPGMILGAVALLDRKAQPSDDEIVKGLDGHVCRCGTYPRILSAVRASAKEP